MNNTTFDNFWDNIIAPAINQCQKDIDSTAKSLIGIECVDQKIYKKELNKIYKRKREWLKKEYLPSQKENAYLDFHKLGSLLCRSVIGNKYFLFSESKALDLYDAIDNSAENKEEKLKKEINSIYINYKLAFYILTGIGYIDLFYKICSAKENTDIKRQKYILNVISAKLQDKHKLFSYKKNTNHDDFESSIVIALMKSDSLMRDFDYLAYSALIFQWQEQTKSEIIFDILLDNELDITIVELKEIRELIL